jgi:hypothetical protein
MVADIDAINRFLQEQLAHRDIDCATAVDAAEWLDQAGLLADSADRPGLPLRRLLRAQKIQGQRQEPNGRWHIDRVGASAGVKRIEETPGASPDPVPIIDRASGYERLGPSNRDEAYVVDLCDDLLGQVALRQHRFDFLRGDAGTPLPVDAYYPGLHLVIEYRESQHTRPTTFFDKPDRLTVSGVHRGEQRALYDQRRRTVLPEHDIALVEISYDELAHTARSKLTRDRHQDRRVLRQKLAELLD